MKSKNWSQSLLSFVSLVMARLRPTPIYSALKLFSFGLAAILPLAGSFLAWGDFSIKFPNTEFSIDGSFLSNSIPLWLQVFLAMISILSFGLGTYVLVSHQKTQNRKRVLCIEHLDYPASQTRGMLENLPKDYQGLTNEFMLIDGRNKTPRERLQAVDRKMRDAKDRISDGSDPNDYFPVYGGIAAVPMVVMAGFFWGNQNRIHLRDYDRSLGSWHDNGNVDDGVLIDSTELPKSSLNNPEAGLCLEFSMAMDQADMDLQFPGIPIFSIHYADGETGLDRLSSEHKQQRLIREIVDYMNSLIKLFPNLAVLHLFITAQSSFVFRVGQALHQNHVPQVRIYHYDAKLPLGQRHAWSLEIAGTNAFNIL